MRVDRVLLVLVCAAAAMADERRVDPTFLYRHASKIAPKALDIASATAHYRPLFGEGDPGSGIVRGVARFAEVTIDSGGAGKLVRYEREEQVYLILEGQGTLHYAGAKHPVRANDFMYLPPGVEHGLSNSSRGKLRAVVMGYHIPAGTPIQKPAGLQIANVDDVKKQVVGNHPPSTLYQLLMGDTRSTRDRLSTGHVLTSLFVMEFTPGGTNFPHHHDTEEEIYLVLDGVGDMVAGGGMDGVEGRHPAKPGDAYFFRLNCTVGFYNSEAPGTKTARVLAVRSLYPFRRR